MDIPDYDRPKADTDTLHLSLPDVLVRQIREVAYRKRRPYSHLCRHLIETALERLAADDADVAEAMEAARTLDGPGGLDRRTGPRKGAAAR